MIKVTYEAENKKAEEFVYPCLRVINSDIALLTVEGYTYLSTACREGVGSSYRWDNPMAVSKHLFRPFYGQVTLVQERT